MCVELGVCFLLLFKLSAQGHPGCEGHAVPIPIIVHDDLCADLTQIGGTCLVPVGPFKFGIADETVPTLLPKKHGNVYLKHADSKQIACIACSQMMDLNPSAIAIRSQPSMQETMLWHAILPSAKILRASVSLAKHHGNVSWPSPSTQVAATQH